ncbi:uncharacterized protein TNCV_657351 [Trichonephila clavipes]|nr:uncharacterized protein TNCV_657351 [Trichonephila clavipes]
MLLCPGKGLVLPKNLTSIKLLQMWRTQICKKRLRSGDLLIEPLSALQTKSFLLANTFLDSSVTISPHKSLNTSRGVISEPDLLSTPESEILEGFSDKAVPFLPNTVEFESPELDGPSVRITREQPLQTFGPQTVESKTSGFDPPPPLPLQFLPK